MTQAPHYAPDEPKARALVLAMEGHSSEAIGPMVGVSGRTVQRWVARCRELSRNQETPEMLDDWVRVTRRSQGMMHTVLDITEHYAEMAGNDHPGPLAEIARQVATKELMKHGLLYNIYAGTGSDKLQKDAKEAPTVNVEKMFIITNAQKPDIIEGEVVDN